MPIAIVQSTQSSLVPHQGGNVLVESAEDQIAMENIVSLSSEDRERKIFMAELNKFMMELGKPLSKIPIMGYKELDLYQLFKEVTSYGGFHEVVKNVGTWSKIWKRLANFDPSITDSSFRLKKNYERYLLEYEYKCFPEHRIQAVEYEKHQQLKRSNENLHVQLGSAPSSPSGSPPQSPTSSFVSSPKTPSRVLKKRKTVADRTSPKVPITLGDLTVLCLGTIIPREPFVDDKHVWPVGFMSTRVYESYINPGSFVKYQSHIVDTGDQPQFIVTPEDDVENPIVAKSATSAWKEVMNRLNKPCPVSGSSRFGTSHPVVSTLIKELPQAAHAYALCSSLSKAPKRRFDDEESSSDEEVNFSNKIQKKQIDCFSARDVHIDAEELDIFESAVATLYALKYSAF